MKRRYALAALALAAALATTGCSQVMAMVSPPAQTRTPEPVAVDEPAVDSAFTADGSVALTSDIADGLEVRVDAWAVNPKRTSEWTAAGEKVMGMAVNVYDYHVSEKAELAQKRRVYLSDIAITSTLSPDQQPGSFAYRADPRTLVPGDTLRSDRGLLLNSFQGGLLIPGLPVGEMPAGTTAATFDISLTLTSESNANSEGSFGDQVVHLSLPVEIFGDAA